MAAAALAPRSQRLATAFGRSGERGACLGSPAHLPLMRAPQPGLARTTPLQSRTPLLPPTAAVAAVAAPLAASASLEGAALAASTFLSPGSIFGFTSALMVPVYFLMALLPQSRLTRAVASSPILPLGLSLLYIFLLGQAMAGGLAESIIGIVSALKAPSYLPDVSALASLFGSPLVTNLAWVHLLLLDFYQARAVLLDGIQYSVPTGHSIALCFLFGPLGLLSHFITRSLHVAFGGARQPAASLL